MKYEDVIKNIKREIIYHFGTQKDFAKWCGISQMQVCRYMKGEQKMPLKLILKISEATGKSPNELMGWANSTKGTKMNNET